MEKIRILLAAAWFIILFVSPSAQDTIPDSLKTDEFQLPDTLELRDVEYEADSTALDRKSRRDPIDKKRASPDTIGTIGDEEEPAVKPEPYIPTAYENRNYLSRGVGDELANPRLLILTHGTVGTPQIPVKYLNVAGMDVRVNGLPFSYNGLYRPYIIGVDLNVIPWEILNDITIRGDYIDLSLGDPGGKRTISDVEVSRGPYGYNSSRWRFFQPLGSRTTAYFTLGFKKTDPFYTNSDYDSYHVTGGAERKLLGGLLSLDLWRHRAKTGLLSFDFLVNQLARQSRGLDRTEISYNRKISDRLKLGLTGLYHRSAQTINGYSAEFKTKNDIGGGKADLSYRIDSLTLSLSSAYYNTRLYGHDGIKPSINIYEHKAKISGSWNKIIYNAGIGYSWAGTDRGAILPDAEIRYDITERYFANLSISRYRRSPDLYLLYYDDYVTGLGSSILESYRFLPVSALKSPLTTAVSAKFGGGFSIFDARIGLSVKSIEDQVRLAYYYPEMGEVIVTPVNYEDRFFEADIAFTGELGPVSGEISAAYRYWDERYFDDGLEKGPALLGFGKLAFEKQLFIPDLFIGGSLEARGSSRRDYRSVQIGLTDGFVIISGRIIFKYKDFTFYLNEDNLTARKYYPLYPYPGTPRAVWWEFKWEFSG